MIFPVHARTREATSLTAFIPTRSIAGAWREAETLEGAAGILARRARPQGWFSRIIIRFAIAILTRAASDLREEAMSALL